MKTLSKAKRIFLISFCCLAFVLTPILITGCGNNVIGTPDMSDTINILELAARDYLDGRTDNSQFTDTTYTFSKSDEETNYQPIVYKKSASDNNTTTEYFAFTDTVTSQLKVETYMINENIALNFSFTESSKSKYYTNNADLTLAQKEDKEDSSYNLTLLPIFDGNTTTYCILFSSNLTRKIAGQDDVVETHNNKYIFDSENSYNEKAFKVLKTLNDTTINSFFGMFGKQSIAPSSLLLELYKKTLDGTKLTLSLDIDTISIGNYDENYEFFRINGSSKAEYVESRIDTFATSYRKSCENYSDDINSTFKVSKGSTSELPASIPDGATETDEILDLLDYICTQISEFNSIN